MSPETTVLAPEVELDHESTVEPFFTVTDQERMSLFDRVPVLPSVRFPRPLSEPAVRVATQRALHGICR